MLVTTRFLIVGTYRTGSSAVVHALNYHPRIACGLEWTQGLMPWRALSMMDRSLEGDLSVLREKHKQQIKDVVSPTKTVLGFKRLFRASNKWVINPAIGPLIVDGLEMHVRWFQRRADIRIIHIVRNDHLAWLKSKAFADASGRFSNTPYPDGMEVTISMREAVRRVRAKVFIDNRLTSLRKTNPYLRVPYEAFAVDNYGKACEMVEFLGCDASDLRLPDLRERVQSRPSHKLVNAEQLKAAMSQFGSNAE